MRIPYVPENPQFEDEKDQAIVERVRQRRGSAGLLELDRALLHAPQVADGWSSFLGSIRTGTSIPDSIRELAICRVAVVNSAWYEWTQHLPILLSSPNMTPSSAQLVRTIPLHGAAAHHQGPLDKKHLAVLQYVDAMTADVRVSDEVFSVLKAEFTEKEVVEITATVAAYNCVSRFLVALDVGEMNGKGGKEGEMGAKEGV